MTLQANVAYGEEEPVAPERSAKKQSEAVAAFDILNKEGKYTDNLALADLNDLPVGLSCTMGNIEYCVAVSGYEFKEYRINLTVFGRIITPHKVLFFGLGT